jgi:hypothetical protein
MDHPAALAELGHYFWDGLYDFDEDGIKERYASVHHVLWDEFDNDNVKACLWYSMVNDKALPPWCRDVLTEEEKTRVEHMLEGWQPSQCNNELAPKITDY